MTGDGSEKHFTLLRELMDLGMTVFDLQNAYIREALSHCRGNKARAARILGVSRSTIAGKIKQFEWEEYAGNCGHTPKRGPGRDF